MRLMGCWPPSFTFLFEGFRLNFGVLMPGHAAIPPKPRQKPEGRIGA